MNPHIFKIDTHFIANRFCGVFLVEQSNRNFSIVEAGSSLSVPPTLEFLKSKNISPDEVKYIFITHAHLDHMGGVGNLAHACQNAIVYCHPQAVAHIVDPTAKLAPAAIDVYGVETFNHDYPNLMKIDPSRVKEMKDDEIVNNFQCIYTPGHAFHHCCFIFEKTIFGGDALGFGFSEINKCPLMCTSPSQFDYKAWKTSILRVQSLIAEGKIEVIQPTHFDAQVGQEDMKKCIDSLLRQVEVYNQIVLECNDKESCKARYMQEIQKELELFGCGQKVDQAYKMIIGDVNVDGLWYRIEKRLARAQKK